MKIWQIFYKGLVDLQYKKAVILANACISFVNNVFPSLSLFHIIKQMLRGLE